MNDADMQLDLGEAAFSEDRLDVAEHIFRLVLATDSANARALNDLGVVLHGRGDRDAAEHYFLKAALLGDDRADPLTNLAAIAEERGAFPEAVTYLERCLEETGETPALLEAMSRLLQRMTERTAGSTSELIKPPPVAAPPPTPAPPFEGRVLMGTMEIANQMSVLSRRLRERGVQADTVSYYATYLGYSATYEYAANKEPNAARRNAETTRIALELLRRYDLFHFWFGTSLTLGHADLPMLRDLGAPVFMEHNGSDVRTLEVAKRNNPYAVCKPVDAAQIDGHLSFLASLIPECITPSIGNVPFVERYYQTVHVLPCALEMAKWSVATEHEQNERPLLVHAPTDRAFKGSAFIIEAVERLRSRYRFDFQLVENMPYEQAQQVYRRADVIIDQICAGHYGGFACEGMALGKPVVVWISDWAMSQFPERPPVISANPDTIEKQLEVAIADAGLRREMGRRAREYVERYHDAVHVAENLLKIYRGERRTKDKVQHWW